MPSKLKTRKLVQTPDPRHIGTFFKGGCFAPLSSVRFFCVDSRGCYVLDTESGELTDLGVAPAKYPEWVVTSASGDRALFYENGPALRLVTLGPRKAKAVRAKLGYIASATFADAHLVLARDSGEGEETLIVDSAFKTVGKAPAGLASGGVLIVPSGKSDGRFSLWRPPFRRAAFSFKLEADQWPTAVTSDGSVVMATDHDEVTLFSLTEEKLLGRVKLTSTGRGHDHEWVSPLGSDRVVRVSRALDVQEEKLTVEVWSLSGLEATATVRLFAEKKMLGLAQQIAVSPTTVVLNRELVVDLIG